MLGAQIGSYYLMPAHFDANSLARIAFSFVKLCNVPPLVAVLLLFAVHFDLGIHLFLVVSFSVVDFFEVLVSLVLLVVDHRCYNTA